MIVKSYIIFVYKGAILTQLGGGITPPEEKIFTIGIFRKITSKYAKLMVEPHICDNLKKNSDFFIFNKKF